MKLKAFQSCRATNRECHLPHRHLVRLRSKVIRLLISLEIRDSLCVEQSRKEISFRIGLASGEPTQTHKMLIHIKNLWKTETTKRERGEYKKVSIEKQVSFYKNYYISCDWGGPHCVYPWGRLPALWLVCSRSPCCWKSPRRSDMWELNWASLDLCVDKRLSHGFFSRFLRMKRFTRKKRHFPSETPHRNATTTEKHTDSYHFVCAHLKGKENEAKNAINFHSRLAEWVLAPPAAPFLWIKVFPNITVFMQRGPAKRVSRVVVVKTAQQFTCTSHTRHRCRLFEAF